MSLPGWIPAPLAKDQWKTVEAVRSQAASVFDRKDLVISDHAEAIRLHCRRAPLSAQRPGVLHHSTRVPGRLYSHSFSIASLAGCP